MPSPSQEPPASSKAQNQNFKEMEVICTFKIQIEKQNSEHGYSKEQCQYPNQDQDAKTQSRTSSVLQSPKTGLKGHGFPLHLQNQGRELKFRTSVYQRQMPTFKFFSPSKF